MRLKNAPVRLDTPYGEVLLERDGQGVPLIAAPDIEALFYAQGWVQMNDRQIEAVLMKILFAGRATECLSDDDGLFAVDSYMKRYNFLPDPEGEIGRLSPETRRTFQAYIDGINGYFALEKPAWELRMAGYRHEAWTMADSLRILNGFGFVGLSDTYGIVEKFLVEMIQGGVPVETLRELFPAITEPVDVESIRKCKLEATTLPPSAKWLSGLAKFSASNNWAVSGAKTASGKPILCSDPHLQIDRVPAVWQELVMRAPDIYFSGATLPGVPGGLIGRTGRIAFGPTYTYLDMLDYRIEECRDGSYRRGEAWLPFTVREELVHRRRKGTVALRFYENENGTLEGDPREAGYYLAQKYSAARDCGAAEIETIVGLLGAKDARRAMELYRGLDSPSFNWAVADVDGNIGMQMSGRPLGRPEGTSGLVPLPAWDERWKYGPSPPKEALPSLYNPPEGFVMTANQDMNGLGAVKTTPAPMADYRARRLADLLGSHEVLDVEAMRRMHYDLLSLQAVEYMVMLGPYLPDSPSGKILAAWDCRYDAESIGAFLFESIYRELMMEFIGERLLGRDVMSHLLAETLIPVDYFGNFDRVILDPASSLFSAEQREEATRAAIAKGLSVEPRPFGESRRIVFRHLLFGGKLPKWLGFDLGPYVIPGSRATVCQGQFFRSGGRATSFCPSYRFIADMADGSSYSNLFGGAVDRRFSPWYARGIEDCLEGRYTRRVMR